MEFFLVFFTAAFALDDDCSPLNYGKYTNCGQDLLVEGFCYKECPDGYEEQANSCIQKSPEIFSLKFFSTTAFRSIHEESLSSYPNAQNQLAPVATEKRGTFFKSSSNIYITKNRFLFGPKLLIVFWLRIYSPGKIFRTSDASLILTSNKFDNIEFCITTMHFNIENKINLSYQWMRVRCLIDFFSYSSGISALISDDGESKAIIENAEIPYKNDWNQLIFGDFLQNDQVFVRLFYQASGYIDLNINLPQFEISDCNINLLESSYENCSQESCIEECCNHQKSQLRRRYLTYIQINDTEYTVTTCPTYYNLVGSQCVWNNSMLEFSFFNNMSAFTDLSGNVRLSLLYTLPVFQVSRGLYFNGVDSGFLIPGIILSPDLVVVCWFNPSSITSMQLLDKTNLLSILIYNRQPGIFLKGAVYSSTVKLDYGSWYQAIFIVIAGTSPIAKIIINRVQTYVTNVDPSKLISSDSTSPTFELGRVYVNDRVFLGWIVYLLYAPYHTAFGSLTFTNYSSNTPQYVYMCNISNYYDGSSCKSCFSGGILECYGPLYNNSYTCAYVMNLCNSKCFCNNGYYWNGTNCSQCYTSCLNCNGPLESDCLLKSNSRNCSAGYFNLSDTCGGITYNSFFPCHSSCSTCSGSNSSNCLSCVQNATLQSNYSCSCSQGWSGTPPSCSKVYLQLLYTLMQAIMLK